MKRIFDLLFPLLIGLLLGALAVYLTWDKVKEWIPKPEIEHITEMDSQVLLERVQNVYKMVVAEGEFADIVQYKDYYLSEYVPGFQKSALLKVKAKVGVGYDLENLRIEMDDETKIMRIQNLPEPEILFVDHDITYYDLQSSIFNEITDADLNRLNKAAKDSIRIAADRSDLMERARNRAGEMINLITFMAQDGGWKIHYVDSIDANSEMLVRVKTLAGDTLLDGGRKIQQGNPNQ
ncbi:MAG: DUF4230 domain-containing protein [Chitinophagales bacterium]